ncbi:hypothetical protein [Campylobacter rectus]|uniref:hypothetical protein n=1 Tax=Campylobacter rectus TaxID=203 RepID=UPI001639D38C|nr:hypothetical protein [Campylobacter rectus]
MEFIKKTFGGLSASCYRRHLFFGAIFMALYIALFYSMGDKRVFTYLLLIGNTFLYPYSRFVYESIVGFIFGDNIFFVNAVYLLVAKFMTMLICWSFAVFIAPFGLIYLYFYHTKNKTFDE